MGLGRDALNDPEPDNYDEEPTQSTERGFDPSRYLTKVSGNDYLETKWRLVWLREVHPDAHIDTELLSHTDQTVIFKATISIPGGGSATGHGSESINDFREYIEKGETKALGRACAALGFGTQFTKEFEFGADVGRVVDSPVDFASTRGRRLAASGGDNRPQAAAGQPATPRQIKFIQAIAREHGMADEQVNAEVEKLYGKPVVQLDRRDASAFIERLLTPVDAEPGHDGAPVDKQSDQKGARVSMTAKQEEAWIRNIKNTTNIAACDRVEGNILEMFNPIPDAVLSALTAQKTAFSMQGR